MKDLSIINRAINNVMNKHITDNGYENNVLFESKIMFQSNSVMFTMMMKQGLFKIEPFKAVFPSSFLMQCDEDHIVKMLCDMFKAAIEQCTKLDEKEILNDKMSFTN